VFNFTFAVDPESAVDIKILARNQSALNALGDRASTFCNAMLLAKPALPWSDLFYGN